MGDDTLVDAITVGDQIREVIARYCQTCDDGRFDEFALLFTDDAEFAVMGKVHVGREAVTAFMTEAQPPERRGKHMTTNCIIDLDPSGSEAAVLTDYSFVARQGTGFAITSVGRYHDRIVRDVDGRWRFARREIVFMGDAPSGTDQP